jgi:ribose transport system ATP-binding protein
MKQRIKLAQALVHGPGILFLDEPTNGLDPKGRMEMLSLIRDLKAGGCGIIYISHRLEEIFEIGDRCTVLRDGRFAGTRAITQMSIPELISLMVGREIDQAARRTERFTTERVVLRVEGLCYQDVLKDISFDLRQGEILGLSGLVGSGRTGWPSASL